MSRPLRTVTFTEPRALSDLIKTEFGAGYCRDTGTIVSGSGVVTLGRVLAKITAFGKWTSYDPTADTGAEIAKAVLLTGRLDATSADVKEAVLLTRGPVEIIAQELNWGAGVTTQAHKDNAIAALTALGIVVRAAA